MRDCTIIRKLGVISPIFAPIRVESYNTSKHWYFGLKMISSLKSKKYRGTGICMSKCTFWCIVCAVTFSSVIALWQSPCCLQHVCTATIEILFAKNCRTHEIWSLKMASRRSNLLVSNLILFNKFPGGACPQTSLHTTCGMYRVGHNAL